MSEFERFAHGTGWTLNDMEYRYHVGRVSQDEWEAFCAMHPATCYRYGAPYTPTTAALMVKISEALPPGRSFHGRPAENLAAAYNLQTSAHQSLFDTNRKATMKNLTCDGYCGHSIDELGATVMHQCKNDVAMIDNKGYVYCPRHGLLRRDVRPCRKLRQHELNKLRRGETLARY